MRKGKIDVGSSWVMISSSFGKITENLVLTSQIAKIKVKIIFVVVCICFDKKKLKTKILNTEIWEKKSQELFIIPAWLFLLINV